MKNFAAAGSLVLFCVCLASYLAFAAIFGRFMQMDEVFFKAAGREWAASGHFAAACHFLHVATIQSRAFVKFLRHRQARAIQESMRGACGIG